MMIPDEMREKGHGSCEDILKVFVTSQPTSFDLLELPRLGGRAKMPEADRTGREVGDGLENWAAMNFSIHISLQEIPENSVIGAFNHRSPRVYALA
jgi:hypothetical protein